MESVNEIFLNCKFKKVFFTIIKSEGLRLFDVPLIQFKKYNYGLQ